MARTIGAPARECYDLAQEHGWSITWRALKQRKQALAAMAAFAAIATLAGFVPALNEAEKVFRYLTALMVSFGLLYYVHDAIVMPLYDEDE